jgi:hypothetical protein
VCELLAIALIRYRFMGKKLANTIIQVVIGVSATNCYTRTRRKPRGTSEVSPGSLCRYRRKRAVACSSPRDGSDGRPLSIVSSPQGDARPSGKMKFGHAEDRNDVVPTKTARYRGGGYWSAAPLLRRCPALCQPPVDVRRGCQAYSADSRKIETKPAKQVESQRLI